MVIAIEATGGLHRPWSSELERRHPGAVRLFVIVLNSTAGFTAHLGDANLDPATAAVFTGSP